jgi:hypothetical protein
MTLREWITDRSSSERETESAMAVAASYLDETVIGNDGESNNTPVAQVSSGELVLSGEETFFVEA